MTGLTVQRWPCHCHCCWRVSLPLTVCCDKLIVSFVGLGCTPLISHGFLSRHCVKSDFCVLTDFLCSPLWCKYAQNALVIGIASYHYHTKFVYICVIVECILVCVRHRWYLGHLSFRCNSKYWVIGISHNSSWNLYCRSLLFTFGQKLWLPLVHF